MTKENVKEALEILEKLPEPYKEVALELLENELLGKRKENEKIMKRIEALSWSVEDE